MEYAKLSPGRAFVLGQALLYYLQRVGTTRRLRHAVSTMLARYKRLRHGRLHVDTEASNAAYIAALRQNGHAALGQLLSEEQLVQTHAALRKKLLVGRGDGHACSNLARFCIDQVPAGVRMAEHDLQDILECPHLLELANDPALLRLAGSRIGCKPTISALGLRWSFPDTRQGSGLQAFHRDCDDWRAVKVLVYLTDVDAGAGPHVYVAGTQDDPCSLQLNACADAQIAQDYPPASVVSITGPAGFGFAVNTRGIHKGMMPSTRARLMLQIQYSLLPVFMYRYRPTTLLRTVQCDQYVNRLFLAKPENAHEAGPDIFGKSRRPGRLRLWRRRVVDRLDVDEFLDAEP